MPRHIGTIIPHRPCLGGAVPARRVRQLPTRSQACAPPNPTPTPNPSRDPNPNPDPNPYPYPYPHPAAQDALLCHVPVLRRGALC